jgi:hypothetical protein
MIMKGPIVQHSNKELQQRIADRLIDDYGFADGMEFAIMNDWQGVMGEILMRKPGIDGRNQIPNQQNANVKRSRTET